MAMMTAISEGSMTMVAAESKVKGRNQILFQHYKEHPEITLTQLGRMFSISKQRASYLVKLQFRKEYIKEEANRFSNTTSSAGDLVVA